MQVNRLSFCYFLTHSQKHDTRQKAVEHDPCLRLRKNAYIRPKFRNAPAMIKGLFTIFLFYFLGETISNLLGGFIPGSVIGMMLLFLALYLKLVKPISVRDTATVITKNMALFFVPTAVGVMTYWQMLSSHFVAIFAAIGISTILTIATVALVQERLEKRKPNPSNDNESL
jgi:holin-like protein